MNQGPKNLYDLAVIGAGTAGNAAGIFAANRGLKTVQVGHVSELGYASGCFDLMGAVPGAGRSSFDNPFFNSPFFKNPWQAVETMTQGNPEHPYASMDRESIQTAFREFSDGLTQAGLPCRAFEDKNQQVITVAGTLKPSYLVPLAMTAGVDAVEKPGTKILIVDIRGLKGFSALQISENLVQQGVKATHARIDFPGRENMGELNCERLAWDIEMGGKLDAFAQKLAPLVKECEVVGLPAILGIYKSESVRKKLEKSLGVPVFEIPTFSPSVTGLRMKENIPEVLRKKGVFVFSNTRINTIEQNEDDHFVFTVEQGIGSTEIIAKNIILASGRFFSRGLCVKQGRISEPLLDIDIAQPESRAFWYEKDFFASCGHAINRCGISTDSCFRPVNKKGTLYNNNLFAAGSILSCQDWKREKSGSGIALASAYAAVSEICIRTGAGNTGKAKIQRTDAAWQNIRTGHAEQQRAG